MRQLQQLLNSAKSPALLLSGGKDSLYLLMLSRQLGYSLPCVWFADGSDDSHIKQLMLDFDLTVWSWQPTNLYLLAHDGSTALVSEYSINGERIPVISDVRSEQGGRCLAESPRTPSLYLPFDLLLSGYKDCDTHWAADGALLYPEGTAVGGVQLAAPIRHLTDDQVVAGLAKLGIDWGDHDDVVPVCGDCIAGKPLHWDKPLDLTTFRARVKL